MSEPVRSTISIKRPAPDDPGFEVIRAKDPMTIVIFGASGDLSKRKLIPALYHLDKAGHLPDRYAVIGFSRTEMSDQEYRDYSLDFMKENKIGNANLNGDDALIKALHYQPGHNDSAESFQELRQKIEEMEKTYNLPPNRLFYLSVAPRFFAEIIKQLNEANLIHDRNSENWSRVVIEKPFGTDLSSARALNREVTSVLDESQIYRIDHYLGKETVQNILSFRFGNSIFEPLFNHRYIDHVQITVAESLGMEGRRGAYYDHAGAMRDMVQNHMFQLLCLTAMEPPSTLDATSIRDEKVKVLRTLQPLTTDEVAANTVRGQFGAGKTKDGKEIVPYRQAEGVDPNSVTETYVALRLNLDNWRWAGVPFVLRTGKHLKKRVSEIAIQFKRPPKHLFQEHTSTEYCLVGEGPIPNQLLLHIQPEEGISLSFACKQPGMRMQLQKVDMDFYYESHFSERVPEAYERLLLDALRGDASLFTRSDEVDHAWQYITSIHEGWDKLPEPNFPNYEPFSDGPKEARRLLEGTQGHWRSIAEM